MFILSVGILSVSSAALFIRFAQQEMPSLVVAAMRLGMASILLSPWVVSKHRTQIAGINSKEWILILGAGFLLAVHFATWITSLEYTSVTSSVVLVTTTPIWVALFSPVILKENPGRMTVIGLVVAILGGMIVSITQECMFTSESITCGFSSGLVHSSALLGNLLALAGAVCAAFYLIFGRILRKTVNLSVYVYCVFSCAALFLVAFVILSGKTFYPYSFTAYGFCLALAVFPQIIGHSSLNWALAYLPIGFVAIVLLGEPVGSTILAAIFLNEIPSVVEILGGLTILLGIYLASRKSN